MNAKLSYKSVAKWIPVLASMEIELCRRELIRIVFVIWRDKLAPSLSLSTSSIVRVSLAFYREKPNQRKAFVRSSCSSNKTFHEADDVKPEAFVGR